MYTPSLHSSMWHQCCVCPFGVAGTTGVTAAEQQSSSEEGEQRRMEWRHKKPSQERALVPANAEPLAKRLKLIEEMAADSDSQSQPNRPQQVRRNG